MNDSMEFTKAGCEARGMYLKNSYALDVKELLSLYMRPAMIQVADGIETELLDLYVQFAREQPTK